MSIHDRDYSRDDRSGGGSFASGFARFLSFLNWSFPIGTYLGIRVRVHIVFVLLLAFRLIEEGDPWWTLRWTSILFLSVLLHEFGHCLACRRVGGTADDILMWPLGGLAYCAPPRRPWPEFVTVVWGPLVNVILAGASYATLLVWFGVGQNPVGLNPFNPIRSFPQNEIALLVMLVFSTNYLLLLFNLALIFYPFDGGRIVQIALWTRMGYVRSMRLACTFGMAGAVVVALVGIVQQNLLLTLIAGFGFMTCYQQKQHLRHEGDVDSAYGLTHGSTYGGGGGVDDEAWRGPQSQPSFRARRQARAAERAREREAAKRQAFDQEIDRLLQKVHERGLASLSEKEKRTLRESTERSRQ